MLQREYNIMKRKISYLLLLCVIGSVAGVFVGKVVKESTIYASLEQSDSQSTQAYTLANHNTEPSSNEGGYIIAQESPAPTSGESPSGSGGLLEYCSYTAFPGVGQVCDLCSLGRALWGLMYLVLFLSVLGAFVYAGYLYLTAAADASAVNKAKSTMTGAVLGLVIGLASAIILQTINPNLLEGKCGLPEAPSDPGPSSSAPGGGAGGGSGSGGSGESGGGPADEELARSGPAQADCNELSSLADAGVNVASGFYGISGPNRTGKVKQPWVEKTKQIQDICENRYGERPFQVTAACTYGVGHSNDSTHYRGEAVDLDPVNATNQQVVSCVQEAGVPDYIDEGTHIHISSGG